MTEGSLYPRSHPISGVLLSGLESCIRGAHIEKEVPSYEFLSSTILINCTNLGNTRTPHVYSRYVVSGRVVVLKLVRALEWFVGSLCVSVEWRQTTGLTSTMGYRVGRNSLREIV